MSSKKHRPSPKGTDPARLNAQQQLFIEAYFANRKMNAEEAGRIAGYAPGVGQKVANHPAVKAAIQKRLQEIIWSHRADRERVLTELTAIAFANPQDLIDDKGNIKSLKDLPQHVARTIRRMRVSLAEEYNEETGETVTVRHFDIDFHDKLTAVNYLMQHLGMFSPVETEVKTAVDWDSMVQPHALPTLEQPDAVEQRLLSYDSSPQQVVIESPTE